MAADGAATPRHVAGLLAELSAWPSLCEAGELGSRWWMMLRFLGMADCGTWRLLFFRPSTAAASLPWLRSSLTGYQWFTSMRDGRGPVTELSADGA